MHFHAQQSGGHPGANSGGVGTQPGPRRNHATKSHLILVQISAYWFKMVRTTVRPKRTVKRFTVSLDAADYEHLRHMAEDRRPPLTLQYLVEYAVQLLIQRAENPQFDFHLADPIDRGN